MLGWSVNRLKMAAWTAKVDRIVAEPAGSNDGFSQTAIDRYSNATFSALSTWEIVCEEVLDTAYPRVYFERLRLELHRRGISDEEYQTMRRFVWLTAGWLNFEKMLWDWCNLDGSDIYRAIEWQYSQGWISKAERDSRRAYADQYASVKERTAPLNPAPQRDVDGDSRPPAV